MKKNGNKTIRIGLAPIHSSDNSFVKNFSYCFSFPYFQASAFSHRKLLRGHIDVTIFHWPDKYFSGSGLMYTAKRVLALSNMILAKKIFKTKYIWVAHNLTPHEKHTNKFILSLFLHTLDGIVALSAISADMVHTMYPSLGKKPILITRHGHYRDTMRTPSAPRPPMGDDLRLIFFGMIRPYKNIETLTELAEHEPAVTFFITGAAKDMDLVDLLRRKAAASSNIVLDIRTTPLPDEDLEQAIDAADAVILPYRNILNSGAAFFALSRNRPVLAPRLGSLPELQAHVGEDWLYLYDGELSPTVLRDFRERLRRSLASVPDLSAYEWDGIGTELREFVRALD